jgi:hypothetical protein
MRIVRYIAFVIAALWIFSILWAVDYCVMHGCSGPNGNNIDGFLPAFALAPVGVPSLIMEPFDSAPNHPSQKEQVTI